MQSSRPTPLLLGAVKSLDKVAERCWGEQKLRNPRIPFSLAYPGCLVSLLIPTVMMVAELRSAVMYRLYPVHPC